MGTPANSSIRPIHNSLLNRRNEVYAHTDRTEVRGIEDLGELGFTPGTYAEAWHPIRRDILPSIIELAASQRERFRAKADELQDQLTA